MRKVGLVLALMAILAVGYRLSPLYSHPQVSNPSRNKVLYWVDPMHPSYTSDKPGVAPDCGMRLEPVFSRASASAAKAEPSQRAFGAIAVDAATQQLIGMQLASVERSGGTRLVRVAGRIVPEDTRIFTVNSGVDGVVLATYNDPVGELVRKDQKLAAYFSPDFLAAASGFLAANERVPGAVTKEGNRSIQNYADRLRNLGMSERQIESMVEKRQLPESVDVVAPVTGFILARDISAGQHFLRDTPFYRITDLSKVWVAAEVSEQEAAYLHPGVIASVTLPNQGRRYSARVTDSLPQSEAGGGTVKLRLEAENPHFFLRPEMLVDIEFSVTMPAAVTVPVDAVVDSGTRTRVYVERGEGVFEPREIETGWRFDDRVEVLRGVRPGERVVSSATFLVDSESRLNAAAAH